MQYCSCAPALQHNRSPVLIHTSVAIRFHGNFSLNIGANSNFITAVTAARAPDSIVPVGTTTVTNAAAGKVDECGTRTLLFQHRQYLSEDLSLDANQRMGLNPLTSVQCDTDSYGLM
jgi:hypothetical protein